jgi:hypothetical protein
VTAPQPDGEPDLHPGTPDVRALQRRVLLTGVLALGAWVLALVVLDAVGGGPFSALLAAVVIYLAVVRPLMAPVRQAVRLRRRLAYQAWLASREEDGRGP